MPTRNLVIEALLDTVPIPDSGMWVGNYLRSAIEDLHQAHRASAADVIHSRLVRRGKIEISGVDQDRRIKYPIP